MLGGLAEDGLFGFWREINALDITATMVKGVEEEDAIDDELSAGWPRYCEQCKKVKPFKTPAGMTATPGTAHRLRQQTTENEGRDTRNETMRDMYGGY